MTIRIYSDNTISDGTRFLGKYVVNQENNRVVSRHVSPIGRNGQPDHDRCIELPNGLKTIDSEGITKEFATWLLQNNFHDSR